MSETSLPSPDLATRLEKLARSIHALGYAADLFPAQWSALRYFARVAPAERTASALARYQGMATGPVTRTVRTLVGKGLLAKGGPLGRGRSERVDVTAAGRALLAADPLAAVVEALDHLGEAERTCFGAALDGVLHRLETGAVAAGEDGS